MQWGVYEPEDRPKQVAPICDEEGNTYHFLYSDCICKWRYEGSVIVHERDFMLDD